MPIRRQKNGVCVWGGGGRGEWGASGSENIDNRSSASSSWQRRKRSCEQCLMMEVASSFCVTLDKSPKKILYVNHISSYEATPTFLVCATVDQVVAGLIYTQVDSGGGGFGRRASGGGRGEWACLARWTSDLKFGVSRRGPCHCFVSSDKKLYLTYLLYLSTQVYKWVLEAYCWG